MTLQSQRRVSRKGWATVRVVTGRELRKGVLNIWLLGDHHFQVLVE